MVFRCPSITTIDKIERKNGKITNKENSGAAGVSAEVGSGVGFDEFASFFAEGVGEAVREGDAEEGTEEGDEGAGVESG